MNIGIDIDGVLTDIERFEIDYGSKFCIEEEIPINIDVSKYLEIDRLGWSDKQAEKFWNKFLVKYVTESNARVFSAEIIKKLQENGYKIYIITARNEYGMPKKYYGKMQKLTKKWLKNQNIKYNKLIFAQDKDKIKQCLENNIDIMIEDCPNNILDISNKIKVIKYDCQYNKNVQGDNIITAYSWYHIYDIINKIEKE